MVILEPNGKTEYYEVEFNNDDLMPKLSKIVERVRQIVSKKQGQGDYTAERRAMLEASNTTVAEISQQIKQRRAMIDPNTTIEPSPEDDDLNDVELGPPACDMGGECEACQ